MSGSQPKSSSWFSTFRKPEDSAVTVLAENISKSSLLGAEQAKPLLNAANEREHHEQWFLVLCEFLYFTLHLANRFAFNLLGHEKRCKFQREIYPLVVRPTIEAVVGHWPEHLKDGIERDFQEKLDDAELEYGACTKIVDRDNPLSEHAVLSRFSANICTLMNVGKEDPAKYLSALLAVEKLAMQAMNDLNLPKAIGDVGKEL